MSSKVPESTVAVMRELARRSKDPAPMLPALDVAAIRAKTGLSQSKFALVYGIDDKTLKNWEQGVRVPQGPARVLLQIIGNSPLTIARELQKIRAQQEKRPPGG